MENFTICAVFVSLDDLDNISILLEEYKDLEGKNNQIGYKYTQNMYRNTVTSSDFKYLF